jgi:hypothetical protein
MPKAEVGGLGGPRGTQTWKIVKRAWGFTPAPPIPSIHHLETLQHSHTNALKGQTEAPNFGAVRYINLQQFSLLLTLCNLFIIKQEGCERKRTSGCNNNIITTMDPFPCPTADLNSGLDPWHPNMHFHALILDSSRDS